MITDPTPDSLIDRYIAEVIPSKSEALFTQLGHQTFQAFLSLASPQQMHEVFCILLPETEFYFKNIEMFKFMCAKAKRKPSDMNTQEETFRSIMACKWYIKEQMDAANGFQEINHLIANYLIPYMRLTGFQIDMDLVAFTVKHYKEFIKRSYHSYQTNRYLNDYRYSFKAEGATSSEIALF